MITKIVFTICTIILTTNLFATPTGDGTGGFRVGNGGGSCITKNGNEITSAKLLDFVEGELNKNLLFKYDRHTTSDAVSLVKLALNKITNLEHKKNIINELNYLWSIKQFTKLPLSEVNDYLTEICKAPQINGEFAQAANYLNSGNILYINEKIFRMMSETDKAGLILHEAIYAYDRKIHQNPNINSLFTRKAVAAIMSTNAKQNYIDKLFKMNFL